MHAYNNKYEVLIDAYTAEIGSENTCKESEKIVQKKCKDSAKVVQRQCKERRVKTVQRKCKDSVEIVQK